MNKHINLYDNELANQYEVSIDGKLSKIKSSMENNFKKGN